MIIIYYRLYNLSAAPWLSHGQVARSDLHAMWQSLRLCHLLWCLCLMRPSISGGIVLRKFYLYTSATRIGRVQVSVCCQGQAVSP